MSPALRALAARTAAPAAALLLVLTLVGLWGSQRSLMRAAREADIQTAARDMAFYADHYSFEHPSYDKWPEGLKLLPPGSSKNIAPHIVSPGSFVEAAVPLKAPDGREVGILRLWRPAQTTRITLRAVRVFTFVSLISSGLLIATAAFTAALSMSASARRLGDKLSSLSATTIASPIATPEELESELNRAAASIASERAARDFLLERHTEFATVSTRECVLLEANPAYCRTFGKTREELAGASFLDLIPSPDRKKALEHLRSLTRKNPTATIKNRVLLPDGSEKWVRWTNTLLPGTDDRGDRILSLGTDISPEQFALEEGAALRDAFEQMQSLARTGSLTWDLRQGTIDMSAEAQRLLGTAKADPSIQDLIEAVHPADRETVRAHFEAARADGAPFEIEFRVPVPGGTDRTLLCRTDLRADPSTKLLSRLTCTLLDASPLRAAEADLRKELEYRKAIESSVAVGIVIRDTRGKIVRVNERFTEMFGWTREDLLGRSPEDTPYWPREEREHLASEVREATTKAGAPSSAERSFVRKDGSSLDILLNATVLRDAGGEPIGSLGVFTDISAVQQMREDLRAAELEARLELMYRSAIEDASASGVLVADRQGSLVHANKVFGEMVGWSEDEILQMPYPYPFCREEDIPAIDEVRSRIIDGVPPRRALSLRLRHKNGSLFDALVRAKPMPGEDDGWVVTVTDVTQLVSARRKMRAAEASSRREAELREAVERAAGVGITAMDKRGVPLYANDAFCAMLGYSREEWMSMRPPYAFWPPEESDRINRALRLGLAGKAPAEGFELVFMRKDGTRVDVLIRDTKLYDDRRRMIGFISSITDITTLQSARRRAEEAEMKAQDELAFRRAIERNADVGIVVHAPGGRMLSVNPAICAMTGWSEEEILAMSPPFPIWPPDEREAIAAAFASHLDGSSPPEGFQFKFLRKDGTDFDVLIRSTTIRDDKGSVTGILSVMTDVSQLQRARRALETSNGRLSLAQSVAQFGSFTWDAESGEVQLDEQAYAIFGYAPGADATSVWRESMGEAERQRLEAAAVRAIAEGSGQKTAFYTIRWPDGSRHEIASSYSLMGSRPDGGSRVLGVLRDVTAEQQAMRKLETYSERLKIVQEVAGLGIWDWDPVTDQLYWDAHSFALFGHLGAEDAKAVWAMTISSKERERLTRELRALISSGAKLGQDRLSVTWPDGSVHEILSTYSILRDEKGGASRVIGVNRDITEQLRTERELLDAGKRMSAALDGAKFGTFEHVFDVGASNWNAANYEINGIDPSITDPHALFEAWKHAVGSSYREIEQKVDAVPPEQQTISYEFTSRPPGREPRRIRSSVFIQRDPGGKPVRLVGVSWLADTRPLENIPAPT